VPKELKFKVGDLIKVFGISMFPFYKDLEDGACGVIIEALDDNDDTNPEKIPSFFFFDYIVLINSKEYFMFEEEMRLYEDDYCDACECDPCDCNWGIE